MATVISIAQLHRYFRKNRLLNETLAPFAISPADACSDQKREKPNPYLQSSLFLYLSAQAEKNSEHSAELKLEQNKALCCVLDLTFMIEQMCR